MATLSPASTAPDLSGAPCAPEEVVHRLTLYFRSLGLPQPQATENAEAIVRDIAREADGSKEDLLNASVERAMEVVTHWLDDVAKLAPEPSDDLRLQLAWYLRPVLGEHPEVFLHAERLPDEIRDAIQAAGRRVLPTPRPTQMSPQSLGEVPRLWYRLAGFCSLFWGRLARLWR